MSIMRYYAFIYTNFTVLMAFIKDVFQTYLFEGALCNHFM